MLDFPLISTPRSSSSLTKAFARSPSLKAVLRKCALESEFPLVPRELSRKATMSGLSNGVLGVQGVFSNKRSYSAVAVGE